MKIDLSGITALQETATQNTRQAAKSTTTTATTESSTSDRTTFSSDTVSVQSLVGKVLSFPPIRQDRVAALRQSISDGTYNVDAGKVASALAESGE
jgi:negative regulator of flagellin synthesis FlgM